MKINYDPTLLENTVFLATRTDRKREAEFHAAADPVYALENARAREARFRDVHTNLFARWGLDRAIAEHLAVRPIIAETVGRCVIRQARRRKNESADLLATKPVGESSPADRTVIIQICPESLLDATRIEQWLPGELLHVADMLDPAFGYRPEAFEAPLAQQNLTRDRYRVLWETYVQGRLDREAAEGGGSQSRLHGAWQRAFGDPSPAVEAAFDRIFRAETLTHGALMQWAARPRVLIGDDGNGTGSRSLDPNTACPLCSFPTHDWFEFAGGRGEDAVDHIRSQRPDWDVAAGACRQCVEIYLAAAAEARDSAPIRRASA